jgi:hypothetical protein
MDEARPHLKLLGFTCKCYVVKYEPFAVIKHISWSFKLYTSVERGFTYAQCFYLNQSSLAPLSMTLRWTLSLQDLRSWEAS